jgi:hypothetical protein
MAVWPSSHVKIPLRYGGFRYGLTLGIGTLKIIASTGVFVLVISSLKHSDIGHGRKPCIIST